MSVSEVANPQNAQLSQRIAKLRSFAQRRKQQLDELEGVTSDPDRQQSYPGCMPKSTHGGVPYNVAQLREAYLATRSAGEKKSVSGKRRAFFCQHLDKDDRMWKELLSHPEKYGQGPIIDESAAFVVKQQEKETTAPKVSSEILNQKEEQLKECEQNNKLLTGERNAFGQQLKKMQSRNRELAKKQREIQQKISALLSDRKNEQQSAAQTAIDLLFSSVDFTDPETVEKWRARVSNISDEHLAQFEKKLSEMKK